MKSAISLVLPAIAAAAFGAGFSLGRATAPTTATPQASVRLQPSFHIRVGDPRLAKVPARAVHRPAVRRAPVTEARVVARDPRPVVTTSLYERSASAAVLRVQGCAAAKRGMNGIVILDFGKPAYQAGQYGTILFSDTFAPDDRITRGLAAYATGYSRCLPRGSNAHLVLARGTSNYSPSVPSTYRAGRLWAHETKILDEMLRLRGLDRHVSAAAADDAEPAWDPGFDRTFNFFRGYRETGIGRPLFNYGSLDGGVGSIWKAWQAYYVAGGMRYARPIPEIYNQEMAKQWAHLAWLAKQRYHTTLRFAGVMTQVASGCACGLRPGTARRALVRELAARRVQADVPVGGTNISSPE